MASTAPSAETTAGEPSTDLGVTSVEMRDHRLQARIEGTRVLELDSVSAARDNCRLLDPGYQQVDRPSEADDAGAKGADPDRGALGQRQPVVGRRAVDERNRRERTAEASGDQCELDGTERFSVKRTESDKPFPGSPGAARPTRSSIDSTSMRCSSLTRGSLCHSFGRERMRSATMFRWICCVPP